MADFATKVENGVAVFASALTGVQLPKALEAGVLEAAQQTTAVIRKQIFSTFPSGRTGGLARSFRESFIGWDSQGVAAGSFSDSVYADIQERGGVIRAKSGRNLAIPIMGGRKLPVGKWPRHFAKGELTLIARKGKPPLLARVKKSRVEPLFVLKPSVRITGRAYLDAARATAAPIIAEILGDKVATAVARAPEK